MPMQKTSELLAAGQDAGSLPPGPLLPTELSRRHFDRIIRAAFKSRRYCSGRSQHVSVLTYSNKIVSIGVNQLKTDTLASRHYNYPYIHSELNAVKKLPATIPHSQCSLYNFRFNNAGQLLMSKPCRSCLALIGAYEISQVYFSSSNNEMIRL